MGRLEKASDISRKKRAPSYLYMSAEQAKNFIFIKKIIKIIKKIKKNPCL